MTISPLGRLSVETFMRDYWHQRPILLRGALAGFDFPVGERQLLDMACEPDRVSRMIWEEGPNEPWEVEFGPFDDEDFAALSEERWTLLVQEADRNNPELTSLMNLFRFIPNWRLDDIQISLAAPNGSAGPHIDNYDVFLVQSHGQRTWKLESAPAAQDRAVHEELALALLKEFNPDLEYVVEPGDVLYLPPRIPHWGIAESRCMTCSIGFRAPDMRGFLLSGLEDLAQGLPGDLLYKDTQRKPASDPGRVSPEVLSWMHDNLSEILRDTEQLEGVFCKHLSMPSGGYFLEERSPVTGQELEEVFQQAQIIERTAAAFLIYRACNDRVFLYGAGCEYELPMELSSFARLIAGTARLDAQALAPYRTSDRAQAVLKDLLQRSILYFCAD